MRVIKRILRIIKKKYNLKVNKFRRVKLHKREILCYHLILPNNFLINYNIMSAFMVEPPKFRDLPHFMALNMYGRFLAGLHHKIT
jgi:hypothetical protein